MPAATGRAIVSKELTRKQEIPMKRTLFKIKELAIQKMPGFPRGMKPYKGFSPDINIIVGPNASGKSSTARALQKLIWSKETAGFQLDGRIDAGGQPWTVHLDSS